MDKASCQYCGTEIEGKAAFCIACETPHHRDCFEENGKCTTYACDCTSFFDAANSETVRLQQNQWSFNSILGCPKNAEAPDLHLDDNRYGTPPSMGSVLIQVGAIMAVLFFVGTATFIRMAENSSRRQARKVAVGSSYRRDSWGKSTRKVKKSKKKKVDWSDIRTLKGTLQTAVLRNNIPLATRMLNMGAPANGRWFRSYPLEIAASRQYKEMCQLLVNHGARPRSARTSAYLRSVGIKMEVKLEKSDGRGY